MAQQIIALKSQLGEKIAYVESLQNEFLEQKAAKKGLKEYQQVTEVSMKNKSAEIEKENERLRQELSDKDDWKQKKFQLEDKLAKAKIESHVMKENLMKKHKQ